jgi:small-conductance mechanosensitive channel
MPAMTTWLVLMAGFLLGQAPPVQDPPSAAAVEPVGEPEPTITIDPDAVQGVDVVLPGEAEQPADGAPEQVGDLAEKLQEMLPETGADSVDDAASSLVKGVADLTEGFLYNLPQIVIAVLVVLVTGGLARLGFNFARRLFQRLRFKASLRDLFAQFVYIGVWFAGLIVAAGIVFPGFGFAELLATAGLVSIAIGFAFQDIFSNFFAGILILWRFPFEVGDYIDIDGVEVSGQVEDIWIRMTLIRQVDGTLTCVPNNTIYNNPVHVWTNRPTRRITVMCGIAYGEDVGEGRAVIEKAVRGCSSVHADQPVEIFAQAFGSSSIDFEVTWWTGPTPLDRRRSRDQVVEAVKKALDEAGIEIPYPYRTLTFTRNEPLIAQVLQRGAGGTSDGDA